MLAEIRHLASSALMPSTPWLYAMVDLSVTDCEGHPCEWPDPPCSISHADHCQFVRQALAAAHAGHWFTVIDELDHDCDGGDVKKTDDCDFSKLPRRVRSALTIIVRYLERRGGKAALKRLCRCLEKHIDKRAAEGNAARPLFDERDEFHKGRE
jgi:hypothetical protein